MELLIICLVIIAVGAYTFFTASKRPSRNPVKEEFDRAAEEYNKNPEKYTIIEDSSHLKEQLRQSQNNHSAALHQVGQLQSQLKLSQSANMQNGAMIIELRDKLDKVTSQKKSGEVRLGQVAEQMLPLLPEFPVPVNTLKFFGNPIDYISIDLDAEMISFIEVKSGGSVLSDKQRKIRKMIEEKKVQWFEVRVDDKGIKVK